MTSLIYDKSLTKRPHRYVSLEFCYDTGFITYQKYQKNDGSFKEESLPIKVAHLVGKPDDESFQTAVRISASWIINELRNGNNLSIFVALIMPQKCEPEIKLLMISRKLGQIANNMPFAQIKVYCKLIRSVDELTNAEKDMPSDYSVEMTEFFLNRKSLAKI